MRVLGGRYRGRVLAVPRGLATRPTGARARTALFDIVGPLLGGAVVADLFAGTGALGLEALSRGASRVDFYEDARPALDALRANIATLGVTDARVVGGSLPGTLREGAPYDVIFMDPPWRKGLELPVATRLIATGRLGPGTLLVVEAAHRDSWDESAWLRARLELTDSRAYGDTEMRFFRAHGTTPE